MKIAFNIQPEDCITALTQIIGIGNIIKSKAAFKRELNKYFELYGRLCLDDHQRENHIHFNSAMTIWATYGEAITGRQLDELESQKFDSLSE